MKWQRINIGLHKQQPVVFAYLGSQSIDSPGHIETEYQCPGVQGMTRKSAAAATGLQNAPVTQVLIPTRDFAKATRRDRQATMGVVLGSRVLLPLETEVRSILSAGTNRGIPLT